MAVAVHKHPERRTGRTTHVIIGIGALVLALLIVVPLVIVLFLAGDTPAPAGRQPAVTEVGAEARGSSVGLLAGDTLRVRLDGNPTTGYSWEVASVDEKVLKLTGEPVFEPASTAIGSPGKVILNFEAASPGTTTLRLVYHRPFEKDVPALETFEVKVEVGK